MNPEEFHVVGSFVVGLIMAALFFRIVATKEASQ